MNNQEENAIARDAALNVGISGADYRNISALSQFMRDFHDIPRYIRRDMGYWGIRSFAEEWWTNNRARFEDKPQRYR